MLTVEFKQNCQAQIVVSDIRGKTITLSRPEGSSITVIDKAAPTTQNEQVTTNTDNTVTVTYTFNEPVTQTGKVENFSTTHTVKFEENGVYSLTFADKAGNVVTEVATITQIDNLAPKIYYAVQIIPQDASIIFSDEAKTQVATTNGNLEIAIGATDANDLVITVTNRNKPSVSMALNNTPTITNDSSKYTKAVTVSENGMYVITAVDKYGNTNVENVRIDFIDKEVPVIAMETTKAIEVVKNSITADALKAKLLEGVTAKDSREGAVSVSVDVTAVQLSTAGSYTVTYTAEDSLGNKATKTRTVSVLEKVRKTLLINGASIAANDIRITTKTTATFDMTAFPGYRLYVAQGYKTRAQMKYAPALTGLTYALTSKGYYTVMAQNGEMDAFLVYIYLD
jgi:hypothetical protein